MKLLLLKILLQRRARDEGFTLPMVIAIGLVMILLGTINIVKSSEENITAISQNSSSDALAIAEVGVTKYRELLNQNRILTVYNRNQWNDADVDAAGDVFDNVSAQACNDMAKTPTGWLDDDDVSSTNVSPNSTSQWWRIKEDLNADGDTTDRGEFIGAYRLVSYIYDNDRNPATNNNGNYSVISDANKDDDSTALAAAAGITVNSITNENDTNDDGKSDARGILTVQGRSPDGSSVAQIEVEIPLRINDLENFAPVLWVGSGAITNTGTLNIPNADDNVILKSSGSGCATPSTIPGTSNVTNNLISDPRNLPAVVALPDTAKKNSFTPSNIDTSTRSEQRILPRPVSPSDNKNDDGRFYYDVTTVKVETNNLETDGTADVTLRATDNITINGSSGNTLTIGNSNAANPSGSYANFTAGSSTNTSVSSANLEIYVVGEKNINIDAKGGTINIEALIHAPDATLNITDSVGSGRVNINGAVWVKNFTNAATVNIRSDKTKTTTGSEPAYKFYTTNASVAPRPLTGTPTNWVREEVQN